MHCHALFHEFGSAQGPSSNHVMAPCFVAYCTRHLGCSIVVLLWERVQRGNEATHRYHVQLRQADLGWPVRLMTFHRLASSQVR